MKHRPSRNRSPRTHRLATACLALTALIGLALTGTGCGARHAEGAAAGKRVIVLGIDGMDYELAGKLMQEGRLPNFSRLAAQGSFSPLGTSAPPLSPVAWSNFITGLDGGGHGIFDFIHRDPKTMIPYLSTSRPEGEEKMLKIGKWQIPLKSPEMKLLRHGEAFWEPLEKRGVPTTIVRIPANFPVSGTATRELSGMGTPDILGTYGTFSFYTSKLFAFAGHEISGGNVYEVDNFENVVHASLVGPTNPYLAKPEKVKADFTVYIDPVDPVARLVVGDTDLILKEGEWSDWVPVTFSLGMGHSLNGVCLFYLRSVRPELELYASPINIDPLGPFMPISTPDDYAAELAEATGIFYTQGMPEDTKALTSGVFTVDEFLAQAHIAGEELIRQYFYVLDHFQEGLLFYYFGNVDQVSHLMWRTMDPGHPAYDPVKDAPYADVLPKLYERMDEVIGYTLDHMGADTRLVVMSDHGFTSWRRSFHLNTWLKENGYLALKDPNRRDDPGLFANVDWSRTRAYGLGLNGLYINVRGRERWGVVDPADRDRLSAEIAAKLLETVDPWTGQPAITKVYQLDKVFHDRGYLAIGPDLVVGYAKMTRGSNESALGEVPPEVFSDNTEAWSGDHGMDHETVPGVLFTNGPLPKPATSLQNLAAAIVAEFGVEQFPSPQ